MKIDPELIPPGSADSGDRRYWPILVVLAVVALTLGGALYWNYSRLLSYVHHTLDDPETPPAWETAELSVEQCVDEAIAWASECKGIKALCDEYVTRVMHDCLGSQSRLAYCEQFTPADTASARFGFAECEARGVVRNVDLESCSNSYRAIDGWCSWERDYAVWLATNGESGAQESGGTGRLDAPVRPRHGSATQE